MPISLSPDTQKLIEEQMKATGVASADELVRGALQTLRQARGEDFDSLDPETRAAIEEGLAQANGGEGRPWEDVREEIRATFPSVIGDGAGAKVGAASAAGLANLS